MSTVSGLSWLYPETLCGFNYVPVNFATKDAGYVSQDERLPWYASAGALSLTPRLSKSYTKVDDTRPCGLLYTFRTTVTYATLTDVNSSLCTPTTMFAWLNSESLVATTLCALALAVKKPASSSGGSYSFLSPQRGICMAAHVFRLER
jgi:hypothetical protein